MFRTILYTAAIGSAVWMSCGQSAAPAADTTASAEQTQTTPAPRADTLLQPTPGHEMVYLFNKYPNMPRIDLRNAAEFKKGHIQRATNWSYYENGKDCMMRLMSLDRNTPLMIYHSDHELVKQIGQQLVAYGFHDVYIFEHGLSDWAAAGQVYVLN